MTYYQYDFLVFIARLQPLHVGHLNVIQSALALSNNVIVLVGSCNQPRTEKNPFTFDERRNMIYRSLEDLDSLTRNRVDVVDLRDQKYNDQKWASSVQQQVSNSVRRNMIHNDIEAQPEPKIGLIGHTKDESSYYLKMFPQWSLVEHELNEEINATDLRNLMFEGKSIKFLQGVLPPSVFKFIGEFTKTDEYITIKREYEMIKKYKKAWEVAPYAPTFVTTDAVVVQSGHILLIQRGAAPGYGLWALVGGFLDQTERIVDGMIRELKEETKIKVPIPVLKGSITKTKVYDAPDRSSRGRTITHVFLIELPPGSLPVVRGNDDAVKAKWVPLADVREDQMFEDHFAIVQDMLGRS